MDKKKIVLVIGGDPKVEWDKLFEGRTLVDGTPVEAVKATWDSLIVNGYSEGGCVVTCPGRPPFQPDIVLVRGALRGAYPSDNRNLLIGFAFCGVRCVNSARSLWLCQDKPLVYAALRDVQRRLGADRFPLIPQSYWPNWRSITFADGFPLVAKVGTVHAGLGKMKISSQQELHDFRSIIAMQGNYATGEPFIDWDYDFRLQKIGPHCRGFRRTSDVWKGASMGSRDADEPLTDLQKLWLDEVSTALGMDILTIDGVHSKDGKDYIVEINDSAIGLNERHLEEDYGHICDLVLSKLEAEAQPDFKKTSGFALASYTDEMPVSRMSDPNAVALEQAQAEVARLRARVKELEDEKQEQQKQQQSSFMSRLFK